jgi:hypothetical protein
VLLSVVGAWMSLRDGLSEIRNNQAHDHQQLEELRKGMNK